MLDSTEGSGAWGEYEGKGEPACALATTRLIPSATLIRVAATNFLDSSPEREHAGFYLGTGITGKVSPCLLRNFHGTVPHPCFRLAQGVADRWCSRGKSPSCSPTDERKRRIVATHAILKLSGRSKSLSLGGAPHSTFGKSGHLASHGSLGSPLSFRGQAVLRAEVISQGESHIRTPKAKEWDQKLNIRLAAAGALVNSARWCPTQRTPEFYMTGPPIETYEALDAGAQIGDRGAKGVITLLTERGLVAISMKRPVMEQLRHSIECELNENLIPSTDADREIS